MEMPSYPTDAIRPQADLEAMTTTIPTSVPASRESFTVALKLLDGYAFRVDFRDSRLATLTTDEQSPLGDDRGPQPSRLLATAVANCLAASLIHCLRKSKVAIEGLEASAVTTLARNERGRMRIERIAVLLDPRIDARDRDRLSRCLSIFEDYCIVTESVRGGIDVRVSVRTD
jgi:uncharacterized OsmC-like protein